MKAGKNKENKKKPFSKKKKRLILVILAGLVLVLAAGYTVFIAPLMEKEKWVYKEETVQKGTLKVGVTESGSLEYGITSILYDLDLDISSDDEDEEVVEKYLRIDEVYVRGGQRIAQGDVLYKFTQDSIADVRMLLQSAAVEAQAEYVQAQSEYDLAVLKAQAEYESTTLEGQYAASIYQNDKKSIDNEMTAIQLEINQRTANAASLQEQLQEATESYNEIWSTFKDAEKPSIENDSNTVNFMIMQKNYLNQQTQYENAKSALNRAQQAVDDNTAQIEALQKEYNALSAKKTINKLDAEALYKKSVINEENAQIIYDAQLESLKETLRESKEEMEKKQNQLEEFEAFVGEDGCLYADANGIVTQVDYETGDRLQSAGTMISYTQPADMTISVDVTQEDIVELKVGDKVDITFVAYPDSTYQGSIQSINTTATSTDSNTVSYTVVIGVEGDTTLLYGGMTADVIFVTEQKEDILYISKKAIVEKDGKNYVYQKNALGTMELHEVQVGITNGVDIEIISGLKEGDTIYLASRVSSEDAVMSKSEEKSSILIGVVGYIAFFLVIIFFSGKIMRPVAESYEKQKRFITDAGHEIKTPLAIINADVDVMAMEQGENEWLEDIKNQTKRLAGLTNDLVYLSRMEEEEKDMQMIEFPFSDVVEEVVCSFQSLAKTQNKILQWMIPDMISLNGNEKAVRQLVNILMDNAIKYSPEEGEISVGVQKQSRNVLLTVSNATLVTIPKDKLDMIFERFYRMDASRSTMTGGYGIGLSVAKAIVNAHNGKISAATVGEDGLKITVTLPV